MSDFTYNDALKLIPKARPRKIPEPRCDPIFEHCINLRKFQSEIEHLILLTTNLNEIYDDSEREPILKSLPSIPELPQLINTIQDTNQKNVTFGEIELSDDTILKLVSKAVARILFVLGYTDMPSQLLQKMSKMIIDYVKSMTELMIELMPEDSSISVELLEAALKEKGISGLGELYSFYNERIVKFHESLYLKCKHLCKDLQNNLKKPDAPPKKNITESSIVEKCSNDVDEMEQNNKANIDNFSKNSLDSGALAEELYLCGKLKRKSVCVTSQTENREASNYKYSDSEKIACDQENSPIKIAVNSESFCSVENVLFKDKISKYCRQGTGLFSNLAYDSDDGPSVPNAVVLNYVTACYSDDEDELPVKNADGFSNDKLSDQMTSIVADVKKVCIKKPIYISNEEPVTQSTSIFANKAIPVPVKEAICYSDDELLDQITSIASDEEKSTNKNAMGTESFMRPFNKIASIVPNKQVASDKNAIPSESHSYLENSLTENLVSFECTKPNSDSSPELHGTVIKFNEKISKKSVGNSNDKLICNGKAKRGSVDLESLESLSDSPSGNRKKRQKLMKHCEVSENDNYMEVKSPKVKGNLKRLGQSSSSNNCNVDGKLHQNELGIISEDISLNNNLNLETCFNFKNGCEISNFVPDLSSSSENETEQIWLSL